MFVLPLSLHRQHLDLFLSSKSMAGQVLAVERVSYSWDPGGDVDWNSHSCQGKPLPSHVWDEFLSNWTCENLTLVFALWMFRWQWAQAAGYIGPVGPRCARSRT